MIIITETWLIEKHLTSEILDDDWMIFRKDRLNCITRGGGVLFVVRKQLDCTEVEVADAIEQLWVKISVSNQTVNLCGIYVPYDYPIATYSDYISVIDEVMNSTNPDDRVLIAGNFNLPYVKWQTDRDNNNFTIPTDLGEFESSINDSLILNNLNQI